MLTRYSTPLLSLEAENLALLVEGLGDREIVVRPNSPTSGGH